MKKEIEYNSPGNKLSYKNENLKVMKGIQRYFSKGMLMFEGIFFNGKRWDGYIFKYDNIGNMIFEGKLSKGEYIIEGKEYDGLNHSLKYEGEYLYGKKHGNGKEYFNGELKFEGEFLYDFKIKGKEYLDKSLEFEGNYLYGKKWNGKGYDKDRNIIYELINGNGKVKEYDNKNQLIYEGEYLNGKRWNGKGKEYNDYNCLIFEEEYKNGEKWNGIINKYNVYRFKIFECEYKNGKLNEKVKKYYLYPILQFE